MFSFIKDVSKLLWLAIGLVLVIITFPLTNYHSASGELNQELSVISQHSVNLFLEQSTDTAKQIRLGVTIAALAKSEGVTIEALKIIEDSDPKVIHGAMIAERSGKFLHSGKPYLNEIEPAIREILPQLRPQENYMISMMPAPRPSDGPLSVGLSGLSLGGWELGDGRLGLVLLYPDFIKRFSFRADEREFAIHFFTREANLIASYPDVSDYFAVGHYFPNFALFDYWKGDKNKEYFNGLDPVRQKESSFHYSVIPQWQIAAVASISKDAAFRRTITKTINRSYLPTIIGFFCLIVTLILYFREKEKAKSEAQVKENMLLNQAILDVFRSRDEGYCLSDKGGQIKQYNESFWAMYPMLTDYLCPGVNFVEMMKKGIERNQFDSSKKSPLIMLEEWQEARLKGGSLLVYLEEGECLLVSECPLSNGDVVSLQTNISHIKRIEEELRLQEERWYSIVNNLPAGVLMHKSNKINFANQEAARIMGVKPDKLLGMDFSTFFPIDLMPGEAARICLSGQEKEVMVKEAGSFIEWDGGIVSCILIEDETERLKSERAVRDSEQHFRAVFESANIGIIIVARTGMIESANSSFCRISGYDKSEIPGINFALMIEKEDAGGVSALFENIDTIYRVYMEIEGNSQIDSRIGWSQEGIAFDFECAGYTKSGEERFWHVTGAPFASSQGRTSMLFMVNDITRTKKAENERRHLEQVLHEGQKLEALGKLAGGVAHELNNLLGPILISAQVIDKTQSMDAANKERLERIIQATRHAGDIVKGILAYSRKEQPKLKEIDVVKVMNDTARLIASVMPAGIKFDAITNLNSAKIMGDEGQLRQVLINLANNAKDAMHGQGEIRLYLDEGIKGLKLKVSDNGSGIPPEVMKKIFDPFFTTKPVGHGTGLGLSVVQGIVGSWGGEINVSSSPGKGTVFTISLPKI